MPDVKKLTSALPAIIGKTIAHVVMAGHTDGRSQLFLIFTDDTHYEFYAVDTLSGARGVDRGGLAAIRIATSDAVMLTEVPRPNKSTSHRVR
jgi:hypothetical protein